VRPVHILVALDWVRSPFVRAAMEWACRTARWPRVLRSERLGHERLSVGNRLEGARVTGKASSAFVAAEAPGYLRRALADSTALLREGEVLAVFPEAYPTIDPAETPRTSDDELLIFRPGYLKLVERAQRDGRTRVPIVPAGLHYERVGTRWH